MAFKKADDAVTEHAAKQAASSMQPVAGERDIEQITHDMGERLFAATNLDELFDALQGNNSQKMVGKTITIHSVEWDEYEADTGAIPLAVVTYTEGDSDETDEFATTGFMATRFLRKAELLGAMPFKARIEGKKTRSKNIALNFVRA